jgi:hypothetical protein
MQCARLWFLVAFLTSVVCPAALSLSDFQAPVDYPITQEAKTVAVGDLNGDGRDDVAVAAWPSGLFVLCQQSDGTLGLPSQLSAPNMPLGLDIGDLNGDARMDIAVGGTSGEILLYHQETDGSLVLADFCSGYGRVNSLVIDDLNGDGLADIADTSADLPVVLVSLQDSQGYFGLPAVYHVGGSNARSIRTLDYNADGRRDIALVVDGQVCYMLGTSDGFADPVYIRADWVCALAAGDVTGDGRDDLVFTAAMNRPDAAIGVIDPLSGVPRLYPSYDYVQPLALADVNGDGRNDVIAANGGYEALTVFTQSVSGGLEGWVTYPGPYSNGFEPGALAVGDLNSDGLPDVAVADPWNGLAALLHTLQPNAPEPELDTTAPVCVASVSGTSGLGGWYTSAVTVTVTAEDEAGGSGLKDVLVTRDGSAWASYLEPLTVLEQGVSSVGYYAEDGAGNRSDVQRLDLKIDATAPRMAVQPSVTTIWPPNGQTVRVPVKVTAADAVSGISSLRLAVVDEYRTVQWQRDVIAGSTVNVPLVASRRQSDPDGRTYTLTLTGMDAAGNQSVATATVMVPRTRPKAKR